MVRGTTIQNRWKSHIICLYGLWMNRNEIIIVTIFFFSILFNCKYFVCWHINLSPSVRIKWDFYCGILIYDDVDGKFSWWVHRRWMELTASWWSILGYQLTQSVISKATPEGTFSSRQGVLVTNLLDSRSILLKTQIKDDNAKTGSNYSENPCWTPQKHLITILIHASYSFFILSINTKGLKRNWKQDLKIPQFF